MEGKNIDKLALIYVKSTQVSLYCMVLKYRKKISWLKTFINISHCMSSPRMYITYSEIAMVQHNSLYALDCLLPTSLYIHRERNTDRQINVQINQQTDRQTNTHTQHTHTHKHTCTNTHKHTHT